MPHAHVITHGRSRSSDVDRQIKTVFMNRPIRFGVVARSETVSDMVSDSAYRAGPFPLVVTDTDKQQDPKSRSRGRCSLGTSVPGYLIEHVR
jgi:hypothetical protein